MSRYYKRRSCLLAACFSTTLMGTAFGQEPPEETEEIVVTATQRTTPIQDVAVAVTPVTADLIDNSGVADIQDLQALVPNLQLNVAENETSATARLRGIGTQGSNAGLESSVGVVVDGVYRVRNGVALGDLGEVSQIEVLRGPQGTLFGRNTSAGLINIRTSGPDLQQFGGQVQGTYGNFDGYRVGGHVNLPLVSDRLALRVFGARAQRDGLISTNPGLATARNDNTRNFWTVRPQLLFSPTNNFVLRLIGDYSRRDEQCCAAAVIDPRTLNGAVFQTPPTIPGGPPGPTIPFGAGPLAAFAGLGAYGPGGLSALGSGSISDRRAFANRSYDQGITDYGVSGEAVWSLGPVNITAISAYRDWTYLQAQDADFTAIDVLFRPADGTDSTEFQNFSQEVRLDGEAGPLNWLIGFIYANEDLTRRNRLFLGTDFGRAFTAVSPNFAALGRLAPIAGLNGAVGGNDDSYLQQAQSIAGFTHNILSLSPKTQLTFGLRFTHETKDLSADFTTLTGGAALALFRGTVEAFLQSPGGGGLSPGAARATAVTVTCNPAQNIGPLGALRSGFCLTNLRNELDGVGVDQRRQENQFTGIFSAAHRFSKSLNSYVSYSRGYKAGGFNLDRDFSFTIDGGAPNPQFAEETVDALEVGAKNTLFGGDLLFNLTGFYSFYNNFQLNTFNGFQFVVTSVPDVTTRGVEIDYIWSTPVRGLTTQGGIALTDARYGNDAAFVGENRNPVNGQLTLFRLPGARLTNSPLWTYTQSLTYRQPLFNEAANGLAYVDLRYVSPQLTGSDLDLTSGQPGYVIVNARLGLDFFQERVALQVWARNLFDVDATQIGFNLPLQTGARGAFLNDPRTFGGTVSLKY